MEKRSGSTSGTVRLAGQLPNCASPSTPFGLRLSTPRTVLRAGPSTASARRWQPPPGVGNMARIKTIIVDDEPLARRGLKTLVDRHAEFAVVASCADGREAIAQISELKPDLVLLDIHMPEITGFDVLERLPRDVLPVVIFVTAYDEHAIRAFEVRALDYLLKPVSQKRFDEALERAAARVRDRQLAEYGAALAAAVADIQQERGTKAGEPAGP